MFEAVAFEVSQIRTRTVRWTQRHSMNQKRSSRDVPFEFGQRNTKSNWCYILVQVEREPFLSGRGRQPAVDLLAGGEPLRDGLLPTVNRRGS